MASDPQTWAELKTVTAEWLNRSDLTAKIPEFIAFAERRFNRVLRCIEMETTATLTASASVALPADFLEMRALHIEADPRSLLEPVSPSYLRSSNPWQTTGRPSVYAIIGSNIITGPAPDSAYNLTIDYYAKIPALGASVADNWLLLAHPDIYLWATLVSAEAYVKNDDRIELWKIGLDEAIGELIQSSNRKRSSASPMRIRNPRGTV